MLGILLVTHVVPKIPLKAVGDKRINYIIKSLSISQKIEIRTNMGKILPNFIWAFLQGTCFLRRGSSVGIQIII